MTSLFGTSQVLCHLVNAIFNHHIRNSSSFHHLLAGSGFAQLMQLFCEPCVIHCNNSGSLSKSHADFVHGARRCQDVHPGFLRRKPDAARGVLREVLCAAAPGAPGPSAALPRRDRCPVRAGLPAAPVPTGTEAACCFHSFSDLLLHTVVDLVRESGRRRLVPIASLFAPPGGSPRSCKHKRRARAFCPSGPGRSPFR